MTMRIVIIGAGISGLVAGILLQNKIINGQRVEVTIFEKRRLLEHIGGGLSIWPNGAQVLLNLPCVNEIKELAGDLREEYWSDAEGNTLRIVDRHLFKQINGYPFMNICRSELQELLLNTFGRSKIIFGTKLINIEQTAGCVTVHFANRSSIRADLVIGADGTFSTVRKSIFPDADMRYTGYIALVGLCRFSEHDKPRHHIIFNKNRQLLVFPISNNRYMVYTVRPYPEKCLDALAHDHTQQIQLFKGWSTEADRILDAVNTHLQYPEFKAHYFCNENFDMKQLAKLHQNRVVLIGDAASRIGSLMGLGTNIALEDAKVLADQLSVAPAISQALEQYSRRQIPRTAPMVALETDKKSFLLEATDKTFDEFKRNAKSSSHDDFFNSLISAISPTTEMKKMHSKSDDLKVKTIMFKKPNQILSSIAEQPLPSSRIRSKL
jgi:FAD-dependent urate hydroxylase